MGNCRLLDAGSGQEFGQTDTVQPAEVGELDNVNPPFSRFAFRDERRVTTEASANLVLREASGLARLAEDTQKLSVPLRVTRCTQDLMTR